MTLTKELIPFSDTSDEELLQNTTDKRIKFTHVDNVPKSVKENSYRKLLQKLTQENSLLRITVFNL